LERRQPEPTAWIVLIPWMFAVVVAAMIYLLPMTRLFESFAE
jgi:hypothetical protein